MRDAAILFSIGFAARVVFIHLYPQVFGGDSVLRLMNRDHILLSYQLPLLQAIVYTMTKAGGGLIAIRYVMALIGALAVVSFHDWVRRLAPGGAFWAALLLATNPFLIQLSIVPYQEVLMLGLLFPAFRFFLSGNLTIASIALGLACLTRYEAWAAVPVLVIASWRHAGFSWRPVLLFGWAPMLWLGLHLGLSPQGTFVAELPRSFQRVLRYVYLAWIVLKNTQPPVFLLAAAGGWALVKDPDWRRSPATLWMGFAGLFLLSIPFSAHGESPDPERFITARTASILIATLLLLATTGIRHGWGVALALAGSVWGVWMGSSFLRRDTAQPPVQLSYHLARFLDAAMGPAEHALILTAEPSIDSYLDKVRQRSGEAGVRIALERMSRIDTSPPDFQRTVVHSTLSRERFLHNRSQGTAQWVAVWGNFTPGDRHSELLATLKDAVARAVLENESLTVRVYRVP